MRSVGLTLTTESARPIFDYIRQDTDTLEHAWSVLDDMHTAGQVVDVVAFNVIVQGAVGLSDLPRAVGLYKAAPTLEVQPDVETFNLLFTGCIAAAHRALGDQLMAEMKVLGVEPDANTYERLIVLCLTQDSYEDAFFYLEEMKAQRHLPSVNVYEALIRKCVSVGDTRYEIALKEMEEAGYPVSDLVADSIRSYNQTVSGEAVEKPRAPRNPTLDEKRALFEAGGKRIRR
jgi:hypothetical protein